MCGALESPTLNVHYTNNIISHKTPHTSLGIARMPSPTIPMELPWPPILAFDRTPTAKNPKRSLWNCWGFAFHHLNLSGSDSFDAMSKRWFSNVLILYFLKSFIDIDFDIGVSISNYMYLIVFIDNLVCMLFVDIFCEFMWKMVIYWNLDDFMTILLISICWWILRFRLCNVNFIWCSFSPPPGIDFSIFWLMRDVGKSENSNIFWKSLCMMWEGKNQNLRAGFRFSVPGFDFLNNFFFNVGLIF